MIVAYDGSQAARRALAHAAELAARDGIVTVVNVIPYQAVSSRIDPVSEKQRDRQDQLLDEAEEILAGLGIRSQTIARIGEPWAEILAAADEARATVIVIGRRNRRLPHLRGSLHGKLIRAATQDVLVVHESAEAAGAASRTPPGRT